MNCTAKQRCAAWILLVGFLLAVLAALTFCAEEVNHDCTGADCAICAQLKLCKNILHAGKDGSGPFIRTLAPHFVLAALLSAFADKNTDSAKGKTVGLRNACPYDS